MRLLRERLAVAELVLAAFATLYLGLGLLAPRELARLGIGLAILYALAFFGVASRWFFGRWFAVGVAASGALSAALAIFQVGSEPVLFLYGGAHGLAWAVLSGAEICATFEGQPGWRDRLHMDEEGVRRLGKAVTRGAASLPYLLTLALGPREPREGVAILALGIAGFSGLLRLRTWGLFVLGGAGLAALAECLLLPVGEPVRRATMLVGLAGNALGGPLGALAAAALALAAAAAFARPAWGHLRR